MTRVYISGKVTGLNNNSVLDRFAKVESKLSERGLSSYNPAWGTYPSWNDAMRSCISLLMQCDCIYMLEGWEKSKGASLERQIAGEVGMDIYYECDDDLGLNTKQLND